MASKRTAHDQLVELDRRIAEAKTAEREAETRRLTAEANVERAKDAVRECHEINANPDTATARLEEAKREAEQAELASEGISQRVVRLTGARERWLAANADRLLDELGPACEEAVEELRTAADALIAADRRWHHTAGQVAGYLRGLNLSPAENQPGEHGLEGPLRELKRALNSELRSPAPHMSRRIATVEEQSRVKQLIRDRLEMV